MKHLRKAHKTPTHERVRHYYWEKKPCESVTGPVVELRYALDNKDEVSIRRLAREHPDLRINGKGTALHEAAAMGDAGLFSDLLEMGSDYSLEDSWYNTALQVAIIAGKPEIVKTFCDFTSGSSHKFGELDPLHCAVRLGCESIVKLLTKDGENLCVGVEKHFH
jgi:hypothetical protein